MAERPPLCSAASSAAAERLRRRDARRRHAPASGAPSRHRGARRRRWTGLPSPRASSPIAAPAPVLPQRRAGRRSPQIGAWTTPGCSRCPRPRSASSSRSRRPPTLRPATSRGWSSRSRGSSRWERARRRCWCCARRARARSCRSSSPGGTSAGRTGGCAAPACSARPSRRSAGASPRWRSTARRSRARARGCGSRRGRGGWSCADGRPSPSRSPWRRRRPSSRRAGCWTRRGSRPRTSRGRTRRRATATAALGCRPAYPSFAAGGRGVQVRASGEKS